MQLCRGVKSQAQIFELHNYESDWLDLKYHDNLFNETNFLRFIFSPLIFMDFKSLTNENMSELSSLKLSKLIDTLYLDLTQS